MNQLNQALPKKADKSDLLDLEKKLDDMMNAMADRMSTQFANKDETAKKFSQLSKKIRELFEILALQGQQDNGETGMLTKKNLGPVACASCEKNLVNIQASPAKYHAWKGLPHRETNDRIARYAQGFSKILNQIRTDPLDPHNGMNTINHNHVGSQSLINKNHSHHHSLDDTHLIRSSQQQYNEIMNNVTNSTLPSPYHDGLDPDGNLNEKAQVGLLKLGLRNPVLATRNNFPHHMSGGYIEKMEENRRRHHSTIRNSQG